MKHNKTGQRKAFQAGQGTFVIAEESAEEVYIGIAAIPARKPDSGPARRRRDGIDFGARGPQSRRAIALLVIFAFSLGAIVAGVVLARAWR